MTTILFSKTPVPVEVTYDQTGLNVGMTVSKWTGSAWVQVGIVTAAPNTGTGSNTYGTTFTPPDNSLYLVELAVFTDNTFTSYQDGYLASSRSFVIDPFIAAALANLQSNLGLRGKVTTLEIGAQIQNNQVQGDVGATELAGSVSTLVIKSQVRDNDIRGDVSC